MSPHEYFYPFSGANIQLFFTPHEKGRRVMR